MITIQIVQNGKVHFSWDLPEGPCQEACTGRVKLDIEQDSSSGVLDTSITMKHCSHAQRRRTP